MHKLLNFICFPILLSGIIILSNGLLDYNTYKIMIEADVETSGEINNKYSEKEITLKGPPVSEKLSFKFFVKVRTKPINPKIISVIKNSDQDIKMSILSEADFDYLNTNKREFVKTVLPIIINENQNIITTRKFVIDLKNKLKSLRHLIRKNYLN